MPRRAMFARHLYDGETVLFRVRGVERSLAALLALPFAWIFHRAYEVVATERRLLLILRVSWLGRSREKSFASVPWSELENVDLGGAGPCRILRISAHGGRWRKVLRVTPTFDAHEGIVSLWRRTRRSSRSGRRA